MKKCIVLVSLVFLLGCMGCGHLQSPIRINVDPTTAIVKAAASSLGYVAGQRYPVESFAVLMATDFLLARNAPLQEVVDVITDKLEDAIKAPYLKLQGQELLDSLSLEMIDGQILIDAGNELAETALHSFLAGLRAGVK